MPIFNTEFASEWAGATHSTNDTEFYRVILRAGRYTLRMHRCSDDLALAGYLLRGEMSHHKHRGHDLSDNACLAAGAMSDRVTDHDAELLCQIDHIAPEYPVGDMTSEVTAIHELLLEAAHRLADAWTEQECEIA